MKAKSTQAYYWTDHIGIPCDATGSRLSLNDLMKQVTDTRIAIQLAADAEWPHTTPANAGIRAEFQLPTRSKFKG